VRIIGHAKIGTTSLDSENLSEDERPKRMQQVKNPIDLIIKEMEENIELEEID